MLGEPFTAFEETICRVTQYFLDKKRITQEACDRLRSRQVRVAERTDDLCIAVYRESDDQACEVSNYGRGMPYFSFHVEDEEERQNRGADHPGVVMEDACHDVVWELVADNARDALSAEGEQAVRILLPSEGPREKIYLHAMCCCGS